MGRKLTEEISTCSRDAAWDSPTYNRWKNVVDGTLKSRLYFVCGVFDATLSARNLYSYAGSRCLQRDQITVLYMQNGKYDQDIVLNSHYSSFINVWFAVSHILLICINKNRLFLVDCVECCSFLSFLYSNHAHARLGHYSMCIVYSSL